MVVPPSWLFPPPASSPFATGSSFRHLARDPRACVIRAGGRIPQLPTDAQEDPPRELRPFESQSERDASGQRDREERGGTGKKSEGAERDQQQPPVSGIDSESPLPYPRLYLEEHTGHVGVSVVRGRHSRQSTDEAYHCPQPLERRRDQRGPEWMEQSGRRGVPPPLPRNEYLPDKRQRDQPYAQRHR